MRQSRLKPGAAIDPLPDRKQTLPAHCCRFRATYQREDLRITLPHAYLFAFS